MSTQSILLIKSIFEELIKWHHYQTVVKNHSTNKYATLFGHLDQEISYFKDLNTEIDLLIRSIITSVGSSTSYLGDGTLKDFPDLQKFLNIDKNKTKQINLINNILLKFETLKKNNTPKSSSTNKNQETFTTHKNEQRSNTVRYNNILKILQQDQNTTADLTHNRSVNFTSAFASSYSENFSIQTVKILILSKFFKQTNDSRRIASIELILNLQQNKQLLYSNSISQKLNLLLLWLSEENNKFIKSEPYCYHTLMSSDLWVTNKHRTLDHKLSLEKKRFFAQKDLLNRLSKIID